LGRHEGPHINLALHQGPDVKSDQDHFGETSFSGKNPAFLENKKVAKFLIRNKLKFNLNFKKEISTAILKWQ